MWSDLTSRLRSGEQLIGTMTRFVREPGIVNVIRNAGFDFMFVDMEHSAFSFETVADIIRSARGFGIPAIVRPPARVKYYMTRLLDIGADGLMIPMTETKEHADEIRLACKYRPIGARGCAGILGQTDFQKMDSKTMLQEANENILIVAQVESEQGVENIESIVQTEGVDAVIIGPHDLSDSLGLVGQVTHPEVEKKIEIVFAACQKHHKYIGIHTGNMEQFKRWKSNGMQILGFQTDANLLYETYTNCIKELNG